MPERRKKMIVLLDDIKIRNDKVFFPYISMSLGAGKIGSLEDLGAALSAAEDEIEFLVSDYNDVPVEEKDYASKVMDVLLSAKDNNPKIKITMM